MLVHLPFLYNRMKTCPIFNDSRLRRSLTLPHRKPSNIPPRVLQTSRPPYRDHAELDEISGLHRVQQRVPLLVVLRHGRHTRLVGLVGLRGGPPARRHGRRHAEAQVLRAQVEGRRSRTHAHSRRNGGHTHEHSRKSRGQAHGQEDTRQGQSAQRQKACGPVRRHYR